MKDKRSLRNARVYPFLIKDLIADEQTEYAFQVFKDMEKQELMQRSKTQINDQRMLADLVRIASKNRSQQTVISEQVFQAVFDYMESRGLAFSAELCTEVRNWFEMEQEISIQEVDISNEMAVCPNCNQSLAENAKLNRYAIEILYLGIQSAVAKSSEQQQASREFYEMQKLMEENGPFQVVIDAANVAYTGSSIYGNIKVPCPGQLSSAAEMALSKWSRVGIFMTKQLFVYYKKTLPKDLSELISAEGVHVIIPNKLNDDLMLLYLALASERKSLNNNSTEPVRIVTNDFMRDHMFIFKNSWQWELIKWFRFRQIKFSFNSQGTPVFQELKINPVLRSKDGAYHLPQVNGKWLCVTNLDKSAPTLYNSVQ